MSDGPIRVGFIGAGRNTRDRHIPGFSKQAGVEFVAVANRSRESGERVAKQFGIRRVEDDWRAVVSAPDVDAVCIGTWPYTHCEMTVAALAAGKHVLCEARMAMNAAEGRRMLEVSRKAPHLVAQLVPSPLTLEVDGALKALLGMATSASFSPLSWPPRASPRSSIATRLCTGARTSRAAGTTSSTWASGTRP